LMNQDILLPTISDVFLTQALLRSRDISHCF
jgi:hypothetical protein